MYSAVTVRKVWFRVELTPVPLQAWPWEQPLFHFSSCICHFQSLSRSHGSPLTHCAEVPWSPEFSWVRTTLGLYLQQHKLSVVWWLTHWVNGKLRNCIYLKKKLILAFIITQGNRVSGHDESLGFRHRDVLILLWKVSWEWVRNCLDALLSVFKILLFRHCFCEITTGRNVKIGLEQPGKCGEVQNLCQCHQYWEE